MTDKLETMGLVETPENAEGAQQEEGNEGEVIVGPNLKEILEAIGPIADGWFESQQQQRDHLLKMAQEQNSYNEKVLYVHKTVFSWQFWTVSGFLAAILFSGLYMWITSETKADEGMLIVSHFAFGIFGVIAGFGIKSAANKQS